MTMLLGRPRKVVARLKAFKGIEAVQGLLLTEEDIEVEDERWSGRRYQRGPSDFDLSTSTKSRKVENVAANPKKNEHGSRFWTRYVFRSDPKDRKGKPGLLEPTEQTAEHPGQIHCSTDISMPYVVYKESRE